MDALSISKSEPAASFAPSSAWRWPISYRTIEPIAILADSLVIVAACVAWRVASGGPVGQAELLAVLAVGPIVCALFIPAAKLRSLYDPSKFLAGSLQVWNVTVIWLGVVILLGVAALALDVAPPLSKANLAFAMVGLIGLLGHRVLWRLTRKALAKGCLRGRRVVLISQAGLSSEPSAIPDLTRYGLHIEHSLRFGLMGDDATLVRQQVDQAIALSVGSDIEEIIVAADVRYWQQLKPHLARLRQLPLPVSLMACNCLGELIKQPSYVLGSSILIEVQRAPLSISERLIKRALDLSCAALGLLILSPLLVLVALLIKLDSPGPILFRQTRLGFNGKPFKIYKLRTMTVLEDGIDVRQATRGDERVTNLGRWLRRTSIDELPQLLNVLKGDMSIVGPRPHAVSHDNQFEKVIADYAFRRHMKPGITGWAQVNGYRGATPKLDLMDRRVRMDIRYIENWSIWLDIGIIARTLVEVFRGQNAY